MTNDSPWLSSEIKDEETCLIRFIAASKRETSRIHKFPGPDHFALRKDLGEDSLSFNWEPIADVRKSYALLALTAGVNGNLIDYSGYVFFRYPIKFLKTVPKFETILYSPVWHGNPSPVGRPNNKSHSSLFCGDFDISTRAILSLHCQNDDETYIKFKIKTIRDEIEALRLRNNETSFHKEWIFEDLESA